MTDLKIPKWFTIVAVIALLWNLMGLMAFTMDLQMTPETMADMDLHQAMASAYENSPLWNWIAYGAAVICGVMGCIALLMKKKIAVLLLTISLIGILVQNYYGFVMTQMYQEIGGTAFVMPLLVILIGIYLVIFSRRSRMSGWIT